MNNKTRLNRIEEELQGLPLPDRIEIYGNLIAREGLSHMGLPPGIPPQEIFAEVLKYKKTYGETLEASLALQGLIMLDWLRQT